MLPLILCVLYSDHPSLCVCVLSDSVTGELKISNHSESFAGIYLCEVNNAVGTEHCRIILNANRRKRKPTECPCPYTLHMTLTCEHERPRFLPFKCSLLVVVPHSPCCSTSYSLCSIHGALKRHCVVLIILSNSDIRSELMEKKKKP